MRKIYPTPTCETCGDKFTRNSGRAQKNRFCSLKCRGLAQRGENHFRWLGGNSNPTTTQEYRVWRLGVLIRDRATCRWCRYEGVVSREHLEVHHIIPRASRPDLALVDDNAITLCRSHHLVVREKEKEYAEFFASLLGTELLDLPSNARRGKFNITHDELRDLYCSRRMSMQDIADLCGVTTGCIKHQMRLAGIKSRTTSEANIAVCAQKLVRKPQKLFIDQVELAKLYHVNRLSAGSIASRLGVNSSSVYRLLRNFNIPIRSMLDAQQNRRAA